VSQMIDERERGDQGLWDRRCVGGGASAEGGVVARGGDSDLDSYFNEGSGRDRRSQGSRRPVPDQISMGSEQSDQDGAGDGGDGDDEGNEKRVDSSGTHCCCSVCSLRILFSHCPPAILHQRLLSVGFLPVAGSKIQGKLIRFRSVEVFWFRNKLQARQTT
jgi:hypothetical protein